MSTPPSGPFPAVHIHSIPRVVLNSVITSPSPLAEIKVRRRP